MRSYDVIVVGLGSMGGAAANQLAGRGLRVLGLEAFWPAHDQGSGHGGSRIIRQSYFEGADYVPLLRSAYRAWRLLEAESGQRLLNLCGGVYIGNQESPIFNGARRAAELWHLPHEILDAEMIKERFPTLSPAEDAQAVFEQNAGYIRPEATISANIALARAKGAELHFAEPVRSWSVTGDSVRVTTGQATYTGERLVLAAGAWTPELLGDLGLPLTVLRQVMYWLGPRFTDQLPYQAYTDQRHPIYIEESTRDADQQIYGFPMLDGPDGGMKVGIHRDQAVRETTAADLDRTVTGAEVRAAGERTARLIPAITGDPVRATACMYTMTPDEHFVIGRHPDHDQVAIACGFSGHGFKFVPVVGEILADLAERGHTDHPIGLFDPTRFSRSR